MCRLGNGAGRYLRVWPKLNDGDDRELPMAIAVPSSSEAGPSLEEILSRHGLKETDLDRECPRDIRNDIAVELGADWEMIGLYLEFSLDELGDIRQQHSSQEMCRVALLDVWSKRKGEGATFSKLASAFHRRKRRDLVDRLCTKLKSILTLVPLSGGLSSLEMPAGNDQQQVQQYQNGSYTTGKVHYVAEPDSVARPSLLGQSKYIISFLYIPFKSFLWADVDYSLFNMSF